MRKEIENAIYDLDIDISEYDDSSELYSAIDYNGTMHEIIDGHIDIYYIDLRKWAVDNYNYVEQANEEGLGTNGKDYHKDIQAGQYIELQGEAYKEIEAIFNEFNEQ